MKRRELFKLGLGAAVASSLPKPAKLQAPAPGPIEVWIGEHRITGFVPGDEVRFEKFQTKRLYNHMALATSIPVALLRGEAPG